MTTSIDSLPMISKQGSQVNTNSTYGLNQAQNSGVPSHRITASENYFKMETPQKQPRLQQHHSLHSESKKQNTTPGLQNKIQLMNISRRNASILDTPELDRRATLQPPKTFESPVKLGKKGVNQSIHLDLIPTTMGSTGVQKSKKCSGINIKNLKLLYQSKCLDLKIPASEDQQQRFVAQC